MPWSVYQGQKTTWGLWFCPSSMCISRVELRSSLPMELLIGPLFIFGFVVSWFDPFWFYLAYFSLDFSVDDCT